MRPGPLATWAHGVIIDPSSNLVAPRAAGSGVAPAHLLDVRSPNGEVFHWADRSLQGVPCVIATPGVNSGLANYAPWLVAGSRFEFNRTMQTDKGSVQIQNLSGDVLQSEWERIVRKSTLEGANFVYRYFAVDLMHAWIEQHGTLTAGNTSRSVVTLSLTQMMQGQDDMPEQQVSENCQLEWGEPRCGATGTTPCQQTYASCQIVVHFTGIQTSYEVNNPAAAANTPVTPVNRARSW